MDFTNVHGVDLLAALGSDADVLASIPEKNRKKGVEAATKALGSMVRSRAAGAFKALVLGDLETSLETALMCYGDRPAGDAEAGDWDAAVDTMAGDIWKPWLGVLSAKWLADHGKTALHLPSQCHALAAQFGAEMYDTVVAPHAPALFAALGVTSEALAAHCAPAPEPKVEIAAPTAAEIEDAGRKGMVHLVALAKPWTDEYDAYEQYTFFEGLVAGPDPVSGTAPDLVLKWAKSAGPGVTGDDIAAWMLHEFNEVPFGAPVPELPKQPLAPPPVSKRSRAKADGPDFAAFVDRISGLSITDHQMAEAFACSRAQISNFRSGKARWTPTDEVREYVARLCEDRAAGLQLVAEELRGAM